MSNRPKIKPVLQDYQRALQSMDTFIDVDANDLKELAERAVHFAAQRSNESIAIAGIMSHPVRTVHPQTTMSEAAHMLVSERISGVPVVDDSGRLVGSSRKRIF